jgi:hypothetical protein
MAALVKKSPEHPKKGLTGRGDFAIFAGLGGVDDLLRPLQGLRSC